MRILDISGTQTKPGIDWKAVRRDSHQIDGVYVKATEGATYLSKYADAGIRGALGACLPMGTYHYGRPDLGDVAHPVRDAQGEADHYLTHRPPQCELPPALDLEEGIGVLTDEALTQWVCAWGDRVADRLGDASAGMLLYASPHYLSHLDPAYSGLRRFRLWVAHYGVLVPRIPHGIGDRPHPWTQYTLWQYTSEARVDGIAKRCDLSRTPPREL